MPPKNKSRAKVNHRKGGPKYVVNADEIEARNANAPPPKANDDSDDEFSGDFDNLDDGVVFDRSGGAEEESTPIVIEDEEKPKFKFKTSNPNDVKPKNIKLKDLNKLAAATEEDDESRMSRKERDEAEAARKKAHYDKLHKEGKTDEFKKDMERLNEARKRREELEAKKKEVDEANEAVVEAMKRTKIRNAAAADEGPTKLDAREVKSMNPKQLKEELKERKLSIQGSKKDLIARLIEAAC
mmetsp:Transcript_21712/g.25689  ORF Transcript_21712/g.25689 Transcript_21712/m.25689 type:complete len:241 (+) Transcript_21712:56-778(+)